MRDECPPRPVVLRRFRCADDHNAGLIKMRNGVTGDATAARVNFVGQYGTVSLDTYLGTDGSPSDKLVINGGTASGSVGVRYQW